MVTIKKIAQYALFSDDRSLDILIENFLRDNPVLKSIPRPEDTDQRTMIMAAALLDLLAARTRQQPPKWTKDEGEMSEPFFLRASALNNEQLRKQCLAEAPEPLKKHGVYATADFLLAV